MDEIEPLRATLTPPPPPRWLVVMKRNAAYILGTLFVAEAAFIFGLLLGLAR